MKKSIKMNEILKYYKEYESATFNYAQLLKHPTWGNRESALETKIYKKDLFDQASEKLTAAIKEAEGKATARTIEVKDICECLHNVEEHLHNITKKALADTYVEYDYHGQTFPAAYRYKPESTHFTAEHNGKEWIITDITRDTCSKTKCKIFLSESAKQAVFEKITEF